MQILAKHLRESHFGVNWTWVNLKETLADVTWQQATTKLEGFNSIAVLVYHINYYVEILTKALAENKLEGSDKFAFDCPLIDSEEAWVSLTEKSWAAVERLAFLIAEFPDSRLNDIFFDEKYGTYHRNFLGVIEHTHYHMGQIVILKKINAIGYKK